MQPAVRIPWGQKSQKLFGVLFGRSCQPVNFALLRPQPLSSFSDAVNEEHEGCWFGTGFRQLSILRETKMHTIFQPTGNSAYIF